jgi:hypothetical protein
MSEPRHTLDELQRWMQAVITHPGGVAAGIASDDARRQIAIVPEQAERVVKRSKALTATERLQIYHHAYFARLLDCLREEYSVLAAALGPELFDAFGVAYLERHPSQSYTLGRLGMTFPEFLEQTRPRETGGQGGTAAWPEFMIDLARLERVVNEVFDGPGVEGESLLDAGRLQQISSDHWPDARLICVPSLRLVKFRFPVNDYFTAIRRGEQPAIPKPGAAHVAVTRRDYRVVRYPLDAAQFELLRALIDGEPVGKAIEHAAAVSRLDDAQLVPALQSWFRLWTAEGFFRDITQPSCSAAPRDDV